jgi:DNA repair protein RadC
MPTPPSRNTQRQPLGPAGARRRTARRLVDDEQQGRVVLLTLLAQAMPWTQAAAAVEAALLRFGDFGSVLAADRTELEALPELGETGAAVLKAAHAAAMHLSLVRLKGTAVLKRMSALIAYLQARSARSPTEDFRALFLDARNRLIADEELARGDVRAVSIFPASVLRRALQLHASAIILVHNHPSGDPTPSIADITLTREIQRAASLLGITVQDHIVLGRGGYASMRQWRLLEAKPAPQLVAADGSLMLAEA